jgi:co-chaperonin GroES (HSP10)
MEKTEITTGSGLNALSWEDRTSRENTILNLLRKTGPLRRDEIYLQVGRWMSADDMDWTLGQLVATEQAFYFNSTGTYGAEAARAPYRALSTVNLEPMPGKIIVRLDQSDQQIGGIWIVRSQRQAIGQIVAIYDEFDDPDTDSHVAPFLQLNDWVIFGQHSGVEVTFSRDKFIVLRESEILCRVIDPETVEDKKGVSAK